MCCQAPADHLAFIPDHRHARGIRYPLAPILSLALIAKLAGHSRLKALAHWAEVRAAELAPLFGLSRPSMPHPPSGAASLVKLSIPVSLKLPCLPSSSLLPPASHLHVAVSSLPLTARLLPVRSRLVRRAASILSPLTCRRRAWYWRNWQ